jgi:hypothetical protein
MAKGRRQRAEGRRKPFKNSSRMGNTYLSIQLKRVNDKK